MVNKQVMKRLEHIRKNLGSAIQMIKKLDLDTADEFDKQDILYALEETDNIAFELEQAIPTL